MHAAASPIILLPPTTSAAQANGTRIVHLTWEASASSTVISYRVFRGTTNGGLYTAHTEGPVTALSFDDSTAQIGATYYYVVTALDANGADSDCSNQVMIFVPLHIVHLTWDPSPGNVIGYRVYRGQTDGGPYVNYTIGPVEASSFDDVTVVPGATYYYVVTSLDAAGNESVYSNQVLIAIPGP